MLRRMPDNPAPRRLRAGLALGTLLLAGVFVTFWLRNPTGAGALEGYGRAGLTALVGGIPALLLALALRRLDEDSPALVVVPIVIAGHLALVALFFGYLPVDPTGCRVLANAGVIRPDCLTPAATRLGAMAEAFAAWLLAGGLVLLLRRRRVAATSETGR